MSKPLVDPQQVDAEDLKNKFGDTADVYAKTRAEAAKLAGEDDDAQQWDDVADTLDEDDAA